MKRVFVWDLPVRVFHWVLLVLVGISFYTGFTGGFVEMDYHMLSGYGVLSLVIFRLIWGFVGGRNARFANFIRGPSAILDYLRQGGDSVGHNPLGALSIIAFLITLLVQAVTGLFANDDIMLEGPLAHLVSYDTSRQLTYIHEINRWLILGLVCLHLVAISYYEVVRKHRLLLPMVTGWKVLQEDRPPEQNRWLLGGILIASIAGGVYYLVTYI